VGEKMIHAESLLDAARDLLLAAYTKTCTVDRHPHCEAASDPDDIAGHVAWMLREILYGASPMSPEKQMRWLCFAQGVLWSLGALTIQEAKEQNYRILNEGKDPPHEIPDT
jgi:hypothetical protein